MKKDIGMNARMLECNNQCCASRELLCLVGFGFCVKNKTKQKVEKCEGGKEFNGFEVTTLTTTRIVLFESVVGMNGQTAALFIGFFLFFCMGGRSCIKRDSE